MIIYLATDHAGFELKEKVKKFLIDREYEVKDFGAKVFDSNDDYPDFMHRVGEAISACATAAPTSSESEQKQSRCVGILFGGSGQGEAMVVNRYKNVRAAVYYGGNLDIIKLSREHNNANVLSLGARFLTEDETLRVVQLWLTTDFTEEERHKRRIGKF